MNLVLRIFTIFFIFCCSLLYGLDRDYYGYYQAYTPPHTRDLPEKFTDINQLKKPDNQERAAQFLAEYFTESKLNPTDYLILIDKLGLNNFENQKLQKSILSRTAVHLAGHYLTDQEGNAKPGLNKFTELIKADGLPLPEEIEAISRYKDTVDEVADNYFGKPQSGDESNSFENQVIKATKEKFSDEELGALLKSSKMLQQSLDVEYQNLVFKILSKEELSQDYLTYLLGTLLFKNNPYTSFYDNSRDYRDMIDEIMKHVDLNHERWSLGKKDNLLCDFIADVYGDTTLGHEEWLIEQEIFDVKHLASRRKAHRQGKAQSIEEAKAYMFMADQLIELGMDIDRPCSSGKTSREYLEVLIAEGFYSPSPVGYDCDDNILGLDICNIASVSEVVGDALSRDERLKKSGLVKDKSVNSISGETKEGCSILLSHLMLDGSGNSASYELRLQGKTSKGITIKAKDKTKLLELINDLPIPRSPKKSN